MSTDSNVKNAFVLNAEDVTSLLENKGPNTLLTVADKIADAYTSQTLKTADVAATEQIFRLLMREAEVRVRVSLSEHLKSNNELPKDIVLSMARDVEQVALPVLQHSEVLDDNDLLELVNSTQEITRYLAVSQRHIVSPVVADSLLSKGHDEVVSTLVNNAGAQISDEGLEKIVDHYPDNRALMHAVSNRAQLPMAVTEKLITVVSESLAAKLKEKYRLTSKDLDQEVEKARESETLKLIGTTRSEEEVSKLVVQLQAFDRLTPTIILSALCQGNFCFFETSLARLSNVAISNARTLISDRGMLGFRAIYNKAGLPESLFSAVRILLKAVHELDAEKVKPGTSSYANRIVERILQLSEIDAPENLSYIIALVRRGQ